MAADREQEIMDVVDEFADALNPPVVESEAERLGLTVEELLRRVVAEVQERLL
jgi:hypothetical protein